MAGHCEDQQTHTECGAKSETLPVGVRTGARNTIKTPNRGDSCRVKSWSHSPSFYVASSIDPKIQAAAIRLICAKPLGTGSIAIFLSRRRAESHAGAQSPSGLYFEARINIIHAGVSTSKPRAFRVARTLGLFSFPQPAVIIVRYEIQPKVNALNPAQLTPGAKTQSRRSRVRRTSRSRPSIECGESASATRGHRMRQHIG